MSWFFNSTFFNSTDFFRPKRWRNALAGADDRWETDLDGRGAVTGSSLHVALFEIRKPELLAHLKEAQERGVEVKIVYQQAGRSGAGVVNQNKEVLEKAGLSPVAIPCGGGNQNELMHNKFVVRLKD